MNRLTLIALTAGLSLSAVPIAAQPAADSENPFVAAAVALAKGLPAGLRTAVDPRTLAPGHVAATVYDGRLEDAVLGRVAAALQGFASVEETVMTCSGPPSPRRCRLTAADRVVTFTSPHSQDGSLIVLIKVSEATGRERQPISKTVYEVELAPTGAGWAVRSIEPLART